MFWFMDNVDGNINIDRYSGKKMDTLKTTLIFPIKPYIMLKQLILLNLNYINNKNNIYFLEYDRFFFPYTLYNI